MTKGKRFGCLKKSLIFLSDNIIFNHLNEIVENLNLVFVYFSRSDNQNNFNTPSSLLQPQLAILQSCHYFNCIICLVFGAWIRYRRVTCDSCNKNVSKDKK